MPPTALIGLDRSTLEPERSTAIPSGELAEVPQPRSTWALPWTSTPVPLPARLITQYSPSATVAATERTRITGAVSRNRLEKGSRWLVVAMSSTAPLSPA